MIKIKWWLHVGTTVKPLVAVTVMYSGNIVNRWNFWAACLLFETIFTFTIIIILFDTIFCPHNYTHKKKKKKKKNICFFLLLQKHKRFIFWKAGSSSVSALKSLCYLLTINKAIFSRLWSNSSTYLPRYCFLVLCNKSGLSISAGYGNTDV